MPRSSKLRKAGLGSIILGLVLMGAGGHGKGDCEGVRAVAGSMRVRFAPGLGNQSMSRLIIQKRRKVRLQY